MTLIANGDQVPGADCWAHCVACDLDFRLGVSVPCLIEVYVAALRAARCPHCYATGNKLHAYSPGVHPSVARSQKGFGFGL